MYDNIVSIFIQDYFFEICLVAGILLFLGAFFKIGFLCSPQYKPNLHRYSIFERRMIFLFLGIVLIAVSILALILNNI